MWRASRDPVGPYSKNRPGGPFKDPFSPHNPNTPYSQYFPAAVAHHLGAAAAYLPSCTPATKIKEK